MLLLLYSCLFCHPVVAGIIAERLTGLFALVHFKLSKLKCVKNELYEETAFIIFF